MPLSRTREAIFMGIGILAGLALSGPAAQAATTAITATLSSQPIYVDNQRVLMTAYSIGGNNYGSETSEGVLLISYTAA